MSDLALVWTTMNDSDVHASREQVRTWADELGLPTGTLTKSSTLGAFRKAHARTVLDIEDGSGALRLSSHEAGKSRLVIKYEVCASTPGVSGQEKVAELKLYQARRTSRGVVKGSQQWKAVIKPGLSGPLRQHTEAWVAQFRTTYDALAFDAPVAAVRRVARLALLSAGMPVLHRPGMYVFYLDRLEITEQVEEFLGRCVHNVDVAIIPIVPDARQRARFAESADAQLAIRVEELSLKIRAWLARPAPAPSTTVMLPRFRSELEALEAAISEHERRLSSTLVLARSLLTQCVGQVSSMHRRADLPVATRP